MIPNFPNFCKLELHHKEFIDNYNKDLPPYSDYVFSSLFIWNIGEEIELSDLHGNLVIKFRDYVTNERFYSFIGNNKILETIEILLTDKSTSGSLPMLKLIPQHNFLEHHIEILTSKYKVTEDEDNFDYIVSVDELFNLEGKKLHHKRKLIRRFLKDYKSRVLIQDLTEESLQKELIALFENWKKNKVKNKGLFNDNEYEAFKKALKAATFLNLKSICVYVNDILVGYSIFEIINKDYALSAFQKADINYKGINEFIIYKIAEYLKNKGHSYINIEQDLGIKGLREAKKPYLSTFLKKYTISRK